MPSSNDFGRVCWTRHSTIVVVSWIAHGILEKRQGERIETVILLRKAVSNKWAIAKLILSLEDIGAARILPRMHVHFSPQVEVTKFNQFERRMRSHRPRQLFCLLSQPDNVVRLYVLDEGEINIIVSLCLRAVHCLGIQNELDLGA